MSSLLLKFFYATAGGLIMDPKLFEAAGAGDVTTLQTILRTDPAALHKMVMTSNRETPLHIAALLGHLEFVKAVLARNPALARERDDQGSSPLHLAAANGPIQVLEEILKVGGGDLCMLRDNGGRLPLHVAAMSGRVDILAKLISEKPESIREVTDGRETVLHLSVMANQFEVVNFLVGRPDLSGMINLQDENGNNILHLGTARKQVQTTRLLLRSTGIDVNATNRRGATALAVLLESPRGHGDVQLEQILLAAGGIIERSPSLPQSHIGRIPPMPSSPQLENERHNKWLSDTRSTLMIVAVLIATITFQAGVNPPGGYYLRSPSNNNCPLSSPPPPPHFRYAFEPRDGQAIIGNMGRYNIFLFFDVVGLSASLSIILLLTVIPLRKKLLMAILVRVMSVAIFSTAMAFLFLALAIVPDSNKVGQTLLWVFCSIWVIILMIAVSSQLVQALVYLLKKLGMKIEKRNYKQFFIVILNSLTIVILLSILITYLIVR